MSNLHAAGATGPAKESVFEIWQRAVAARNLRAALDDESIATPEREFLRQNQIAQKMAVLFEQANALDLVASLQPA